MLRSSTTKLYPSSCLVYFLHNIISIIFIRQHFLFGTVGYNGIEPPRVLITTSASELQFLSLSCQIYNGHMMEMSRQLSISLREKRRREKKARLQTRIEAQQVVIY